MGDEREPELPPMVETTMGGSLDDSVLGKVHLLLSSFLIGKATLGLTELARVSGVPKASVYRLAQQLVELGYLVKTTRGYQLGWRLYEFAQLVPGTGRLREIARPSLVDLRMSIKALVVHLAVPRGAQVVYLDRIGGRGELALLTVVAATVPATQTVSGRVLQAYRTLTPPEGLSPALTRDLEQIRQRRWAGEYGSIMPGTKSFAVPIEFPGTAQVIASLSATVTAGRQDEQAIIRALWGASVEIGRALQRGPIR